MTGSTGSAFLHIAHFVADTGVTSPEDAAVTVNALEKCRMDGMAKGRGTSFPHLKNYVNCRFMTLFTIPFYAKDRRTIVAPTAGGTFFHLGHTETLVVRPGIEKLVMAVVARIGRDMFVVAEAGIIRE